jgi:hypothetical protein
MKNEAITRKHHLIRTAGSVLCGLIGMVLGSSIAFDILFAVCLSLDFNVILSLVYDMRGGV